MEVGTYARTSAQEAWEQAKDIPRLAKTPGTGYLNGQG
jgi:hypothetical protein